MGLCTDYDETLTLQAVVWFRFFFRHFVHLHFFLQTTVILILRKMSTMWAIGIEY